MHITVKFDELSISRHEIARLSSAASVHKIARPSSGQCALTNFTT